MIRMLRRLGRVVLRIFPREFRDRYGDDVVDFFTTRTREVRAKDGRAGVVRFWVRGALDVLQTAAAERREERSMQKAGSRMGALSDLRLDVRFALRALRRSPGFAAVALATLALGIGSSTAIFSILNASMGQDLPFPEPDRLVMGRGTFDGQVRPWVSYPNYLDYQDQAESLESFAAVGMGAELQTITGAGEPEQARVAELSQNLFETLGIAPALGGHFTIDEQPEGGGGQVIVSHGFWQRRYGGDPGVVGQSLTVDGRSLTVMGILPAGFRFLYDVDLWKVPWPGNSDPITRRYTNWLTVGRLADGVSLEAAQAEIDAIAIHLQETYPDPNEGRGLQLDGLQTVMLEGYRPSLLLLTGAIVLVLLIACGNVASLLMAKASTRTSELALRAALGAGKRRLARQLLVECTILALAAGVLGVALAVWVQKAILGFISLDLLGIREVGISFTMLGIGLALSLATVVIFGVIPSLSASGANPADGLKEGSRGSTSGSGIHYRSGLVVLQVALSLILLVGSGLLIRSFARIRGVDPGFRVENLLTATVTLPRSDYPDGQQQLRFFQDLKESVEALPGVESVALIDRLPILHPWANYPIYAPERPPSGQSLTADRRSILPGYFETMEIPLLEGRVLDESDVEGSPPVVVLNRGAARLLYPDESALGRQVVVDLGGEDYTTSEVVGIVGDHQLTSLTRGSMRPAVFFPLAQLPVRKMRLAVTTGVEPASLLRPIQERLWELDSDIVLSTPQTMEDALSNTIAGFRSMATVLGLFASVALGLAALGLYGVLAFFVAQRVHEIGIRVALGASGGSVLRLIVNRGMLLVAAGSILGIAGALGATRLVEGMLFQISTTDPITYAGMVGFFLMVALGACLLPAWRALRVDPVEAFRAE